MERSKIEEEFVSGDGGREGKKERKKEEEEEEKEEEREGMDVMMWENATRHLTDTTKINQPK